MPLSSGPNVHALDGKSRGVRGTSGRRCCPAAHAGTPLGLLAVVRRTGLSTLTNLAEAGDITPAVDSTCPLAEAPAAVRHLEKGHPRGKAVLTVT
ncbi:zinc-binding dehydrogenase [Streptomyces sp. CC224B]|uniref:zinc-binding dehydrogenase n=1 Tax=Streptomyces sp. CC224B TaxID=3044571 RepID=UPI0024A98B07|nr:zinc-binding dehydrogenase [Streptomyces sp. CC224B]